MIEIPTRGRNFEPVKYSGYQREINPNGRIQSNDA
jgi:hypothetical protein